MASFASATVVAGWWGLAAVAGGNGCGARRPGRGGGDGVVVAGLASVVAGASGVAGAVKSGQAGVMGAGRIGGAGRIRETFGADGPGIFYRAGAGTGGRIGETVGADGPGCEVRRRGQVGRGVRDGAVVAGAAGLGCGAGRETGREAGWG